jgi:hypothetical protein
MNCLSLTYDNVPSLMRCLYHRSVLGPLDPDNSGYIFVYPPEIFYYKYL